MNPRQQLARNVFRWSDRVLYVDRGMVVMNKPPGMVTQLDSSTTNTDGGNLAKLLDDLKQSLELPRPPYRVHRLDKGTTGCLMLARSIDTARELSLQLKTRTVQKTYLALVRAGSKSFAQTTGQIQLQLTYSDGRAKILQEGEVPASPPQDSITQWEVVGSSPHLPLSLLRLKLITGRKHQLRVHAAHILNAPILGDSLYSHTQPVQEIQDAFDFPDDRIFLHASQISFYRYRHSGGKKRFRIRLIAPLPYDFVRICSEARILVNDYEQGGGLFVSESGNENDYQHVVNGEIPDVNGYWIPLQ
ncbi:pseudouridine synthase [Mycena rebaudengoi]|nr:pseudouridine synthase [Mycena rebaudengoi]